MKSQDRGWEVNGSSACSKHIGSMAATCHKTSAGWALAFTGDLELASESADRITSAIILGKAGRSIAYHLLARRVPSTSQPLSVVQRGTQRKGRASKCEWP